jgi:hypothetical protein
MNSAATNFAKYLLIFSFSRLVTVSGTRFSIEFYSLKTSDYKHRHPTGHLTWHFQDAAYCALKYIKVVNVYYSSNDRYIHHRNDFLFL